MFAQSSSHFSVPGGGLKLPATRTSKMLVVFNCISSASLSLFDKVVKFSSVFKLKTGIWSFWHTPFISIWISFKTSARKASLSPVSKQHNCTKLPVFPSRRLQISFSYWSVTMNSWLWFPFVTVTWNKMTYIIISVKQSMVKDVSPLSHEMYASFLLNMRRRFTIKPLLCDITNSIFDVTKSL